MDDMSQKGRRMSKPNYGEDHQMAKLNWEQVLAIRSRYAAGDITQMALAKEFGVCRSLISHIITRRLWKTRDNISAKRKKKRCKPNS